MQCQIKDYIFDYIKNSQEIPRLISEKRFDKIIEKTIKDCYNKIVLMEEKDEAVAILATVLLHYLLTNALITSQRKVEFDNIPLDVVIPDIKTLQRDPKKALLICISDSSQLDMVKEKISELEKIQPEKENIWMILSEELPVKHRSFVLSRDGGSFSNIISEITQFSNINGTNKFKIIK